MDTTDGMFMNLAYGWAFFNPVRKVYYNLAITGLSVAICFFIGGDRDARPDPEEIKGLSQHRGFWGFMYNFNINTAGFVIVGMFIVTWARRMLIWRFGHIEEKWSARTAARNAGERRILEAHHVPAPVITAQAFREHHIGRQTCRRATFAGGPAFGSRGQILTEIGSQRSMRETGSASSR